MVSSNLPTCAAARSANTSTDSAFGGMHLFATEAWESSSSTAHTLCTDCAAATHSCDSDGLALTGPQSLVLRAPYIDATSSAVLRTGTLRGRQN